MSSFHNCIGFVIPVKNIRMPNPVDLSEVKVYFCLKMWNKNVYTCLTYEDTENYRHFYFTLLIFCKVRAHSFLVFKSSNSRKVWKFQTQTVFASLRKERNKNTIYKGNWSQDMNDVSKYMQCIWSKIYV